MDLSTCSFVAPSFARESAASLPGTLQWEGIHCRLTAWPLQSEARAAGRSLCSVYLFDWRACRTDRASARRKDLARTPSSDSKRKIKERKKIHDMASESEDTSDDDDIKHGTINIFSIRSEVFTTMDVWALEKPARHRLI